MGKDFIEYQSKSGRIPYKGNTVCYCLTQYAKNYIATKRDAITDIDEDVRDGVLVDVINYLGSYGGADFALYTKDLHDGTINYEEVEPQCLLTTIRNYFASYIFNYGVAESVLINKHMNNCTKKISEQDGITIIIDFINYIAEVNEYDIRFTISDFYKRNEIQNYNIEMEKLKSFLEKVSEYNELLLNGENIDSIYNEVAKKFNLGKVSRQGTYYYNDDPKRKMDFWKKSEVEEEIYAMTYAYGKLSNINTKNPQTAIIKKKLLEMKKNK